VLGEHEGADPRIPWDVLVNLFERLPSSYHDSGDFAGVVLRVKELYDVANEWQQEISALTMLSLRGGKRRNLTLQSPGKDEESDAKDPSSVIEMKKVAELCHHPILEKVKNICLPGRVVRSARPNVLFFCHRSPCHGNQVSRTCYKTARNLRPRSTNC
jgi:hypothetical protein